MKIMKIVKSAYPPQDDLEVLWLNPKDSSLSIYGSNGWECVKALPITTEIEDLSNQIMANVASMLQEQNERINRLELGYLPAKEED